MSRFHEIARSYPGLRVAVVGDFCLDRYLDIDPGLAENSIETGLPVYNVVRVRAQPGGAGTVLNNLVALGVGKIHAVGFCGEDGEGYELRRALAALPGVDTEHFLWTPECRTFTYCKPMLIEPGHPPRELNRLDSKNWRPTPPAIAKRLAGSVRVLSGSVDAVIVLDQVDLAGTGVVTASVLEAVAALPKTIPVLADSRRGLGGYPPVIFKMNGAELAALTGQTAQLTVEAIQAAARRLADGNQRQVFVTLAERGLVGASPGAEVVHVPALPVRGPIDVVGAGDSVTANLTAALAAGATPREAMELAAMASSLVIHQLGTTGTASVPQMEILLGADHAP